MTTRDRLYDLVDELPDDRLDEAEELLERIAHVKNGKHAWRVEDAPLEDEELTAEEVAALARLDRGESDAREYTRKEIEQLLDDAAKQ